jgi:predicted dienelactone hydrolase
LRQFPVDGLRINSTLALDLINEATRKIEQTEAAIATIETVAADKAAQQPDLDLPLDPKQLGTVPFDQQTLILNDPARNRLFPADLYLPKRTVGQKLPLVVISHGLGSDRQTFAYLAEHLASHGFAVAVPEHPGSNAEQLQELAAGLERDLTPPQELIDRPLDIQFLLDQIAERYGRQVETERVGIIGQSFGGYTALALAGADINWPALEAHCPTARYSLNWSLVLQCAALKLPSTQEPTLRDPRIVGAIAINPLTSTIFGAEQLSKIQVPVMLISGGADTVTPALEEQITAFGQLRAPQSHLALLSKGTHFSTLGQSETEVPLPEEIIGPDPAIARNYVRALSLAFFEVNVGARSEYAVFLSSAYAQQISNPVNPLAVITP